MAMTFANHADDSKDGSNYGGRKETRALWDIPT